MSLEKVFSVEVAGVKFGTGVTNEVGFEMRRLGSRRVMVVTDSNMVRLEPVEITLRSLEREGIDAEVFEDVHIEPTDRSFKFAIECAKEGRFDGYVAVGGGSVIDTAKAANLYTTYPADFLEYVNAPIGKGTPVPGPLKPLVAIPTTSGTGSETTGVAIFDFLEMKAKTGISHSSLRPAIGLVDPDNARTQPKMVSACSGFDILCHGIESFTANPFSKREAPKNPGLRPSYQGSNPLSDIWSQKAIEMVAQNIYRAVNDKDDKEAVTCMAMAATFAGLGFGNAGVHLPHGMSYPVSGLVRDFSPEGYPTDYPIIPHGMSVILNAPAAFRFTGPSDPGRHLKVAELMGMDISGANPGDAGPILSKAIIELAKKMGMPNGLKAVGYDEGDIEKLVKGTLPQHRVTKLSPRVADEDVLRQLFLDSMALW